MWNSGSFGSLAGSHTAIANETENYSLSTNSCSPRRDTAITSTTIGQQSPVNRHLSTGNDHSLTTSHLHTHGRNRRLGSEKFPFFEGCFKPMWQLSRPHLGNDHLHIGNDNSLTATCSWGLLTTAVHWWPSSPSGGEQMSTFESRVSA